MVGKDHRNANGSKFLMQLMPFGSRYIAVLCMNIFINFVK